MPRGPRIENGAPEPTGGTTPEEAGSEQAGFTEKLGEAVNTFPEPLLRKEEGLLLTQPGEGVAGEVLVQGETESHGELEAESKWPLGRGEKCPSPVGHEQAGSPCEQRIPHGSANDAPLPLPNCHLDRSPSPHPGALD